MTEDIVSLKTKNKKREEKMSKIRESIVLVGGGGGVYRVAKFLKYIRPNITTIQTTFDHGGHSGSLRDERGILPPGDIRQAILALSDDRIAPSLRALLSYRFVPKNGSSLDSATVGNILLTALAEINGGNMVIAINTLCEWFRVKGKVLPVSLNNAELCVKLSNGLIVRGEGLIDKREASDDSFIVSAFLEPEAHLYSEAYSSIVDADKIVFCPGDLFTSIIPNTLVCGFKEAIKESKAKIIFVTNIMTKRSETNNFTASRFCKTLLQHIGRDFFDVVVCNNGKISDFLRDSYKKEFARMVKVDHDSLLKYTKQIIATSLVDETGGIVRHSERIASVVASL